MLDDDNLKLEERRTITEKLRSIAKSLGEDIGHGSDPLADKWEREIAEGKTPDFDEQL